MLNVVIEVETPPLSKKAVAGLVLGVIAMLLTLLASGGFLLAAVGMACSIPAYLDTRDGRRKGTLAALFGIFINGIALVIGLAQIAFALATD